MQHDFEKIWYDMHKSWVILDQTAWVFSVVRFHQGLEQLIKYNNTESFFSHRSNIYMKGYGFQSI